MSNLCPCGSQKEAEQCCLPIIYGKRDAETALQLMRSRYTAFTRADGAYLMRSHHSATRPVKDRKNIENWARSVEWMGLVILGTKAGEAPDNTGYVEFRALYLEQGVLHEIHEKSLFKRENGKWVYHSGEHF
ncbi:YchJ family protein [Mangrovibacterium diazotrophicum]|uniref:SEC-C motif-containing protein n=1 Tax=Mangrovibacterium diazotrophicum TaxID=1261403 RepID=A0A419W3U6_9BACT|nr:YchJ family metal-binding protein [Mangrovibacterium diazotrophicum]RKD89990.1 SEC-C motif-containing protein [Mangrovibacterium diazotrophicum]